MKWLVKVVSFLLTHAELKTEDRIALTNTILGKLNALPAEDIFYTAENGKMMLGTREIDVEMARKLRESARGALENTALNVAMEQVIFTSTLLAFRVGDTPDKMLFGRAAIWHDGEVKKLLKKMAAQEEGETT